MTIILFTGAGQSEKLMKVEYKNNKYIKNNFINKLKKNNKYYYSRYKI